MKAFAWNGELDIEVVDVHAPYSVLPGSRVGVEVTVKRVLPARVDPTRIRDALLWSAKLANAERYLSGGVHMLRTLTCQSGREGDPVPFLYVAIERADCNVTAACALTRAYAQRELAGRAVPEHDTFDEDRAPLLLWRARRSLCRQLLAAVAFLHRGSEAGQGSLAHVVPSFHGNLKPSNVLMKRGICKISEVDFLEKQEGSSAEAERMRVLFSPHLGAEDAVELTALEAAGLTASERWYRLRSYSDTFACGRLAEFILTLGGSLSVRGDGTLPGAISRASATAAEWTTRVAQGLATAAADAELSPPASSSAHMPPGISAAAACMEDAPDPRASHSFSTLGLVPTRAKGLLPGSGSSLEVVDIDGEPTQPRSLDFAATLRVTASRKHDLTLHQNYVQVADSTDFFEAADLVAGLTNPDHSTRTLPQEALAHAFFWSTSRKFLLVAMASEGTVVQNNKASGRHAAFAAGLQTACLRHLPAHGRWAAVLPPPAATGSAGWSHPSWSHREPASYEALYAGPFSCYGLLRYVRNLYVHGPSSVREGLFLSQAHLEAWVLSAFPWLIVELLRVDREVNGGRFTAQALSSGSARVIVGDQGVDAEMDAGAAGDILAAPVPGAAGEATGSALDLQALVGAGVQAEPFPPLPSVLGPPLAPQILYVPATSLHGSGGRARRGSFAQPGYEVEGGRGGRGRYHGRHRAPRQEGGRVVLAQWE
jgi:hypothetical protein